MLFGTIAFLSKKFSCVIIPRELFKTWRNLLSFRGHGARDERILKTNRFYDLCFTFLLTSVTTHSGVPRDWGGGECPGYVLTRALEDRGHIYFGELLQHLLPYTIKFGQKNKKQC